MLTRFLFLLRTRLGVGARISPRADLKACALIEIDARCKVHSRATLDATGGGIRLGEAVTINRYAMIQAGERGVRIGRGSEINNYTVINGTGGVTVGEDVLVGPHVRIISYQHRFDDPSRTIKAQGITTAPIVIGDDCWIGAGATILAGVEIGRGSVVGAGAVVTKSCPPGSVLIGVPARVARRRDGFGEACGDDRATKRGDSHA